MRLDVGRRCGIRRLWQCDRSLRSVWHEKVWDQHTPMRDGIRGVTYQSWFEFPVARPALNEVNFWRPGGHREFHALAPGEPFFCRTHYPHNKVSAVASTAGSPRCGCPRRGNCSAPVTASTA